MGCLLCHSLSAVESDQALISSAVKEMVLLKGTYSSTYNDGLMYIKQDGAYYLNYERGRGGCLCCSCCRNRYILNRISRVELIEDEVMRYTTKNSIDLSPGVRIIVASSSGDTTTLLVAMEDAAEFASKLRSACGLTSL